MSCSSTKPKIENYIPISEFEINNPRASFLLVKFPTYENFFDSDTIFVEPGTLIFSPDSILKKVVEKPNPFSPPTDFKFILLNAESVEISISPLDSSFIKQVYLGYLNKGYYDLLLNENEIESGVYWINFRVGKQNKSKKFLLLK